MTKHDNPVADAPQHQVRAVFDKDTITVYQAYSSEIAVPAVAAGKLVSPFSLNRMTWIKPSFLWMMYRCGWAMKPGQEHVLALRIARSGFEWALEHSCLSTFDNTLYADHDQWLERQRVSPVRIQWDPERDLQFRPLSYRSIQIGLSGEATRRYAREWITQMTDITPLVHQIHTAVEADDQDVRAMLPAEQPYPLPPAIAAIVDAR